MSNNIDHDPRVIEALAAKYAAEARLADSEQQVQAAQAALTDLDLKNKLIEQQFLEARDNRHNQFRLEDQISEFSCHELHADIRAHVRRQLKLPEEERNYDLEIILNSPGGSIMAGFELIDNLNQYKKLGFRYIFRVRAMAASMAAVILQVGDERYCGRNAEVMIHRAFFGSIGKAFEIEDQVEFVQKLEGKIIRICADRSGKDESVFYDLFKQRKDIWLDSKQATELGLVDGEG